MTGNEFKAWRKVRGYTQGEAAEELGVTKRAVQKWEAGEAPISRTVALACAAITAGLEPVGANEPTAEE